METLANIILPLIIVFAIVFSIWDSYNKKRNVLFSSKLRNARNIRISLIPFIFDKGNYTYSVEYEDEQGEVHQTTCKVSTLSGDVYWQDGS